MEIFKRSKLTPEILEQWKREAEQEIIYTTAETIFDLSMAISKRTGGKVDMKKTETYGLTDILAVSGKNKVTYLLNICHLI